MKIKKRKKPYCNNVKEEKENHLGLKKERKQKNTEKKGTTFYGETFSKIELLQKRKMIKLRERKNEMVL